MELFFFCRTLQTLYRIPTRLQTFIFADAYIGNVGLAITQSLGLVGIVQLGVRKWTDLENNMTSMERVLEYTNMPHEGALESLSSNTQQ